MEKRILIACDDKESINILNILSCYKCEIILYDTYNLKKLLNKIKTRSNIIVHSDNLELRIQFYKPAIIITNLSYYKNIIELAIKELPNTNDFSLFSDLLFNIQNEKCNFFQTLDSKQIINCVNGGIIELKKPIVEEYDIIQPSYQMSLQLSNETENNIGIIHKSEQMIHLVTTFFISKMNTVMDENRNKELVQSLLNNIHCSIIEKIHVFVEDTDSYNKLVEITNNSEKIVIINMTQQPTYTDYFEYILNNIPNNICMIANSDIYIRNLNLDILNKLHEDKYVYALTRHEHDMSNFLIKNYTGSHDCYIFHSKFLTKTIINGDYTDFIQNLPGIESRIISTFCDSGFKAYNPCFQIIIVHLHKTNLRNHGKWIGLHRDGDDDFMKKNCWYVPPIKL
jgi:hypothetical protein